VKFRGILAIGITLVGFVIFDGIQRLVITPLVWLRPSNRTVVLTQWIRMLAWFLITVPKSIGGARIQALPKIPAEPGLLILMNHQSVFDLPLVVAAVQGGYPLVVTRERYTRWIPVISHLVRLYRYPVVNPVAHAGTLRGMIKKLRETARTAEQPLMIFPEGTRTKDGEIAPLKVRGLELVLRTRPWKVCVVVGDGFWQFAKMKDLLGGMSSLRGKMEVAGVLEWDDPKGDPEVFAGEVRRLMVSKLAEMRAEEPSA
jgi:1-acyl-sn-glycerol-3-phosphate acyltransferase